MTILGKHSCLKLIFETVLYAILDPGFHLLKVLITPPSYLLGPSCDSTTAIESVLRNTGGNLIISFIFNISVLIFVRLTLILH